MSPEIEAGDHEQRRRARKRDAQQRNDDGEEHEQAEPDGDAALAHRVEQDDGEHGAGDAPEEHPADAREVHRLVLAHRGQHEQERDRENERPRNQPRIDERENRRRHQGEAEPHGALQRRSDGDDERREQKFRKRREAEHRAKP